MKNNNSQKIISTYKEVIMPTYKSFPLVLTKGNGMYVDDSEGNSYLDFVGGIAVNTLGHGHPRLVKALTEQINEMIHCSNLYVIPRQVELAQRLVGYTGTASTVDTGSATAQSGHGNSPEISQVPFFTKAFFCNSGTEAIEGGLKLARKFGKKEKQGAYKIIAMENSFHGRTMGALSVTGQEKYQTPFKPLIDGIIFVPLNDSGALEAAVDEQTCGIIIEPIQGEGGINPASPEFLLKARELCDSHNMLLLFDEVQCGFGRTGTLFAFEQFGVVPDAVCLAKGMAAGFPMGSVLTNKRGNCFEPGDHAATFGGNPAACRAALTVLEELLDYGLLKQTTETGAYLQQQLIALQKTFPVISQVRGKGLMQGIELTIDPKKVVQGCMDRGLLLVGAGEKVVRFVPPLIAQKTHIDQAMKILSQTLHELQGGS